MKSKKSYVVVSQHSNVDQEKLRRRVQITPIEFLPSSTFFPKQHIFVHSRKLKVSTRSSNVLSHQQFYQILLRVILSWRNPCIELPLLSDSTLLRLAINPIFLALDRIKYLLSLTVDWSHCLNISGLILQIVLITLENHLELPWKVGTMVVRREGTNDC